MKNDRLPDLAYAKNIAIDVETYDRDLAEKGPGVRRGDSYLIGLGVATEAESHYFPFAHESGNLYTREEVIRWAKKELTRERQPKVGTSLLYDLDWLYGAGIRVAGPFFDIQIAEPLIDENKMSISLNTLAKQYLGIQKDIGYLEEYCESKKWKGDPRKHLWKIPGTTVKRYGQSDVEQPLKILKEQIKILKERGLYDHFVNVESVLLELLVQMRQTGVPVNTKKAKILLRDFKIKRKTLLKKLGTDNIWAAQEVSRILDRHGVEYNLTKKTKKPSITKPWLILQDHPICKDIVKARKLDKFVSTFLEGQVLGQAINGYVHPQFHPMKGSGGGTVSGRFACSNPNLQFTPTAKADPEMGPLIRSLFTARPGEYWGRHDYSQIELRILAHYAIGPGSDSIREEYNKNSATDYHDWMVKKTGKTRKETKTITFGINYGMGLAALAAELNVTKNEAKVFLSDYFKKVPFVEQTFKAVSQVAAQRGYIKTILGRRRHFDFWEPSDFNLSKATTYSRDKDKIIAFVKESVLNYLKPSFSKRPRSGVRRAMTYKALNALIQGSAADVMKKAMVDLYNAGVFNIVTPLLTMHDELGISYPKNKIGEETFKEVERIMETTIKFRVPILVESEKGPNWGELK